MSKRRVRKGGDRRADPGQRILLDQLKEIAGNIGTEVREEKLVREVGYSVRSGPCRLHGRPVVLLDSNAELGERIEALLEFLAECDLDAVYIEPEIRELIGARAPKESRGAEG
jgi:hypothetical protein